MGIRRLKRSKNLIVSNTKVNFSLEYALLGGDSTGVIWRFDCSGDWVVILKLFCNIWRSHFVCGAMGKGKGAILSLGANHSYGPKHESTQTTVPVPSVFPKSRMRSGKYSGMGMGDSSS